MQRKMTNQQPNVGWAGGFGEEEKRKPRLKGIPHQSLWVFVPHERLPKLIPEETGVSGEEGCVFSGTYSNRKS